jgi:hypothetical protein
MTTHTPVTVEENDHLQEICNWLPKKLMHLLLLVLHRLKIPLVPSWSPLYDTNSLRQWNWYKRFTRTIAHL